MGEHELFDFETTELDGFEVWDRIVQAPAGQEKNTAFVSVRPGGVIGMNKATREMLGHPEAVKVMFDPARKRLGIIPASPDDPRSHRLAYAQEQLSCKKLFEHYGVEINSSGRVHDLQVVDGILIVNL